MIEPVVDIILVVRLRGELAFSLSPADRLERDRRKFLEMRMLYIIIRVVVIA